MGASLSGFAYSFCNRRDANVAARLPSPKRPRSSACPWLSFGELLVAGGLSARHWRAPSFSFLWSRSVRGLGQWCAPDSCGCHPPNSTRNTACTWLSFGAALAAGGSGARGGGSFGFRTWVCDSVALCGSAGWICGATQCFAHVGCTYLTAVRRALLDNGAAAPFLPSFNSDMRLLELLAWHCGISGCPSCWLLAGAMGVAARRALRARRFAQHGVGWYPRRVLRRLATRA